jgi:hypothetical protein
MVNRMVKRFAAFVLLVASTGCGDDGSATGEVVAATSSEITGGSLVLSNVEPYSSAVKFWDVLRPIQDEPTDIFCSGVKIGSRRFLTAAHCNVLINPAVSVGARVVMTNSLSGASGTTIGVSRAFIHPTYSFPGINYIDLTRLANVTTDIMVVDVTADTPSIPVLSPDTTTFGDDWTWTLLGYGCDDGFSSNDRKKQVSDFTSLSLANFQTRFVPGGSYSHAATYNRYVIYDGTNRAPGAPPTPWKQGCPGDSGGPTLRYDGNAWRVAAISGHIQDGTGIFPTAKLTFASRVARVQPWIVGPVSTKIKGAAGSITNALTGKCLGVNGQTAEFTPVVQELCADRVETSGSQYWTPQNVAGGYVSMVNERSGKCMHANNGFLEQRNCNPNDLAQHFLTFVGAPTLARIAHRNGAYLGVRGHGSPSPFGSITVDVTASEGGNRQMWIWTP